MPDPTPSSSAAASWGTIPPSQYQGPGLQELLARSAREHFAQLVRKRSNSERGVPRAVDLRSAFDAALAEHIVIDRTEGDTTCLRTWGSQQRTQAERDWYNTYGMQPPQTTKAAVLNDHCASYKAGVRAGRLEMLRELEVWLKGQLA